ncbi:MAG: hypothetical protein MJ081_09035 [Ruminococcus sp.]|nr:hypothetical protein [Ruminococcus sp.]
MKIIITQDGATLVADNIVEIRTMFIDISDNTLHDFVDDETDFDSIEFAVAVFTVNDNMAVLGIYATEEERNYAKYKLDMYLCDSQSNKFEMPERK